MVCPHIDVDRHRIETSAYVAECRTRLDAAGALVLPRFFTQAAVALAVAESSGRENDAFFARSTHNVYLTEIDPDLPATHPSNRQVVSTKGLIADDQIPPDSPLRELYDDPSFRRFLAGVVGVESVHPYADDLSSINVHFAPEGCELGWHFDNSSFAVTMLLRAPEGGGRFEYVPAARTSAVGDMAFDRVASVLDGTESVMTLSFEPGDLVLFRGRDALHRITATEGGTTRMLVVFAFNDQPGVALSDSALRTFYGRTH